VIAVSHLYGGSLPSLYRAAKAMRNECRGSGALLRFLLDHPHWFEWISVPVQLLIVYCGLTFVAMPMLPIGPEKSKLVYGSADGGKTVNNSDMLVARFFSEFAASLHLAPHPVMSGRKGRDGRYTAAILHTAGDVEGHRCLRTGAAATAEQRILLDLARVLPPESSHMAMGPFLPAPHRPFHPKGIWNQSLREEHMRDLAGLVSSDVFSLWGQIDRDYYNRHAHAATRDLLTERVQLLAQELVQRHRASVLPDLDLLVRYLWRRLGGEPSRLSMQMLVLVRHVLEQDILVHGRGAAKTLKSLSEEVLQRFFGFGLPEGMLFRVYDDFEPWLCSGTSLSALFHEFGVPMRHLGLVRAAVLQTDWVMREQVARWCRDEALARTIKQLMRSIMRGQNLPSVDHFVL
jgi:hypothetical protein